MQDISCADFGTRFELPRLPVVITKATSEWPAQQKWTEASLADAYADHKFKVQPILLR